MYFSFEIWLRMIKLKMISRNLHLSDIAARIGWLVVLRINVGLAIFQPYLDLEARDDQSLKIQVARQGIEPRSSCSASQELNHSATAAPHCGKNTWTTVSLLVDTRCYWVTNKCHTNSFSQCGSKLHLTL